MKQDKWTQQLHDKLAEHETAAPPDLWADIEAALPKVHRSPFIVHRCTPSCWWCTGMVEYAVVRANTCSGREHHA